MKAKEVLKRYAAGERDFRGVNLRGQSFKNANLSGADFSNAELHGTKFTGTTLIGTNFTDTRCGLQKRWVLFLIMILFLLFIFSGFIVGISGGLIGSLLGGVSQFSKSSSITFFVGLLTLAVLSIFFTAIIQGNLELALVIGSFSLALTVVISIAYGYSGNGFFLHTVPLILVSSVSLAGVGCGVAIIILATALSILLKGKITIIFSFIIPFISVVNGINVGLESSTFAGITNRQFAHIIARFETLAVVGLSIYLGWHFLYKENKNTFIRWISITISAFKGTNFYNADLTNANFTEARLKSTDFRKANLTRVCWYESKMLDRVRPGDSYLKNAQVRQWLIGKGKDKNFDRQDLREINLEGDQNLTDASFIKADLSGANLRGTDLSRAKLVQTWLDDTDLTGATLTGAFIEDWGITSSTKLDGVKCEYVFMRLPPEKRPSWLALPVEQSLDPNPRRKPDNWKENFEDNDFADFIQPIFDTLDLYHNQGVDPRAIAISWKQLADNNPDANLRFASMEVKGENNLLLRLKTKPNADLSKLSAEYFDSYNQYKGLSESEFRILLIEKITNFEEQIKEINQNKNMIENALNQNKSNNYYITGGNVYNTENAGIVHNEKSEITGNAKVAGVINEAEQKNLANAAQEIQQLLEQLSENYPTNTSKEKMIVVGEVVDQIEQNPRLKTKVINALKAGGTEAFKEAVNHPLVNILLATIEGWQDGN